MANVVVWVDIPALDLDRAIKFYSAVFGTELPRFDAGGFDLGFLPGGDGSGSSGCIFLAEKVKPSDQGPLVYLNCGGRLEEAEAAIEPAGGKVLEPIHQIGPHGYRVVFLDTEGNRFALHSM
jgi:predicted enzyme related to lactoylglutathione lyase